MNFWPFSKKSKSGPSDQHPLPDGVVLSGDATLPQDSESPKATQSENSPPAQSQMPVETSNASVASPLPEKEAPPKIENSGATQEQSTSWAADLLKPGQAPSEPGQSPPSVPAPTEASVNQSMADVLQKATGGHESLFQKPAILITDNTGQEPGEVPLSHETAEPSPSANKVMDDEHNTAMDYLFDAEGNSNTPKDFWADPPSSAAGIESGLFAPLEAITPTLTDALGPQNHALRDLGSLGATERNETREENLPELPDLSDVLEPPGTIHSTEPVDPVEDELASLALSITGTSETPIASEAKPTAGALDTEKRDNEKRIEETPIAAYEEPAISDEWLSPSLSVSDLAASSKPAGQNEKPTAIELESDIVLKPHQPDTLETRLPALEIEKAAPVLDSNNYGPLPVYEDSMADELDRFGKKVILQDTRFMKNSIDNLIERYFSSKDDD